MPCCGARLKIHSFKERRYTFYLFSVSDRPFLDSSTPVSRKLNVVVGDSVSFSFRVQAFPAVSSATNWNFVNTNGQVQELPAGFSYSFLSSPYYSCTFRFAAETYYGNYSITFNNTIGSTTVTFQVLRPGK